MAETENSGPVMTPLHVAYLMSNEEAVVSSLRAGAHVDARLLHIKWNNFWLIYICRCGTSRYTPLMIANPQQRTIIKILIKNGCNKWRGRHCSITWMYSIFKCCLLGAERCKIRYEKQERRLQLTLPHTHIIVKCWFWVRFLLVILYSHCNCRDTNSFIKYQRI